MKRVSQRSARRLAFVLVPSFFVVLVLFGPLYEVLATHLVGVRNLSVPLWEAPLRRVGDQYLLGLWRFKLALFPDPGPGLPTVRLYVPEQNRRLLLVNPPGSIRHWREARLQYPDGSLDKVRVRLRGDSNPQNYAFSKKSWRVKTKRKNLYKDRRVYNYIVPQLPNRIGEVLAADLARWSGVLTPNVQPVELYVNDVSQGIYFEVEHINETFLRASGVMPVNLYKGDRDLDGPAELFGLFHSPALWKKIAENNKLPEPDRRDLEKFLDLLRAAGSSVDDFERLKRAAPFDSWARFAAFQVLTQSWHNDSEHNMRLVVDDKSGTVTPVAWDVNPSWDHGDFRLIHDSHPLMTLYKRSARFALTELRHLYRLALQERVLSATVARLDTLVPAYANSLVRDAGQIQRIPFSKAISLLAHPTNALDVLAKMRVHLLALEQWIGRQLEGAPNISWSQNRGDVFQIVVNGVRPVDGLEITLAPGSLRPNEFALDTDRDKKFGPGDLTLRTADQDGRIRFDAVWLANREIKAISGVHQGANTLQNTGLKTVPTVFNIVASGPFKVLSVHARNALDGSTAVARFQRESHATRNITGNPVLETSTVPETWSGTVRIEETKIVSRAVHIEAGTRLEISPGASLVFRKQLVVAGTEGAPVVVRSGNNEPFGVFAVHGPGTAGSRLRYLDIANGSGTNVDGTSYSAMLSVASTRDIVIENLRMQSNHRTDDMLHIVYGRDIVLRHADLSDAISDAIDIDISSVLLEDVRISRAGNDCIDLMTSTVVVRNAELTTCGDKGLSIGEGSQAVIESTAIKDSKTGIQVKDGAFASAKGVEFESNVIQIDAYLKNWRYGAGGRIEVTNSRFAVANKGVNSITTDALSNVVITNSIFEGKTVSKGRVRIDSLETGFQ